MNCPNSPLLNSFHMVVMEIVPVPPPAPDRDAGLEPGCLDTSRSDAVFVTVGPGRCGAACLVYVNADARWVGGGTLRAPMELAVPPPNLSSELFYFDLLTRVRNEAGKRGRRRSCRSAAGRSDQQPTTEAKTIERSEI